MKHPIQLAHACALSLCILATTSGLAPAAHAEPATQPLPDIRVIGRRDDQQRVAIDPTLTPVTQPNTAALLQRAPGGAVNFNGPMTGIGQYRGMFGYRLNTRVDGVPINPGGPNWMDAPLHYAPMPLLEALEMQRGITPVSAGNETIGGHVKARRRTSEFASGSAPEFHGSINASAQSVDAGFGLGGILSIANDTHRGHVLGVVENGDDTEFDGGDITPTEYERSAWGAGYGFTAGDNVLSFDYMRNETDDAGTPALPMDIRYVDTDLFRGEYRGEIGSTELQARLYYTDVEHEMDNYSLRLSPAPPGFRMTHATGETMGFELGAGWNLGNGYLALGVDGDFSEHEADISNPNNPAFFVQNFNDVERDRYGVFAEWTTPRSNTWSYELGVRYTHVDADAGLVDGTPAQVAPPAQNLRDRFNAADRDLDWDNIDAVAKLAFRLSDSLILDVGLAHKERAPVYQELYLWLPLRATAGLADGKNYVGNLDLDQEKANIVEVGLDWRGSGHYIGPRVFYKQVDDYIQGIPSTDPDVIAVSTNTGDPVPLQFTNVDAKLYGIDTDFGLQLGERLRLDGVISYVRGQRRDTNDDLYRIPPLNALIGLSYDRERWSATIESVFADEQEDVSQTNEEIETDGYGLLNVYGTYEFPRQVMLTAGVNNAFDKEYENHTNGLNRAGGSDVLVGERLPDPGRSFFARLSVSW